MSGNDPTLDALARVERQLGTLVALMRIGFATELGRVQREIGDDPVAASILKVAGNWVSAGRLKRQVAAATGISEATIKRRAAELAARGALDRRGAGPKVEYRSTGLIDL
jgi:hypothetical protein